MFRWLFLASLAVATPASAKWQSVAQIVVTGTTDFVGPGDIVASATAWYGLRGYSAAVASTGTQKAINVRRQSDNATSDILIKTGGELDLGAATAFAGTDATCQGTIASTTIALTGCSSTPTANDPVSGGGIVQPSYIVSCGAFVAGAGSCTLNAAQTVSVAETITMQVALFVTKWYDQSGNLRDLIQATPGSQPQLILSAVNSLPGVLFSGAQVLSGATISATPQPITISAVTERTAVNSTATILSTLATVEAGAYYIAAPNEIGGFAGSTAIATGVADNALHSVQFVFNDAGGGGSVVYADGISTAVSYGTNGTSTTARVGGDGSGGNFLTGYMMETGLWAAAFSGANNPAMCHNQFTYWGTSVSC